MSDQRASKVLAVAALFVQRGGVYFDLPSVDPWDEERDARLYAGPYPVVAHPPCSAWSRLAPVNEARYGHPVGDDDGCFAAAIGAVRRWRGVLEHPAGSRAWARFDLPRPPRSRWQRGICGGWVCEVSQCAYGHRAEKLTWLYAFGVDPMPLDWSRPEPTAWVSYLSNHGDGGIPRLTKREASATPPAFRDMLLALARSAEGQRS